MSLPSNLSELYSEYTRLAGAEISFEVTTLLQQLCESEQPKLIIDLGSGWSSFALRCIAPEAIVWSVDTIRSWLDVTIRFCAAHEVPDDGCFVMLDQFEKLLPRLKGTADIVLHDMGRTPMRLEKLPMALDLVKPGGIIVLDDMHKEILCAPMIIYLQSRPEFTVYDQANNVLNMHTIKAQDLHNRFAWTARRASI